MYHPQSGWFDEGPQRGQYPKAMQGPSGPTTTHERASRPSRLLGKGLTPLQWQLFLPFLLLLLVADICSEDLLVQSDGAHTRASRPAMPPGTMPLAPHTLPMHPDRRLACEPARGVG